MIQLSYTKTPTIELNLRKVENEQIRLLTFILTPSQEMLVRFNHTVTKLYYASRFLGGELEKEKIISILAPKDSKKYRGEEKDIWRYKKTQDYLYFNWVGNKKIVEVADIEELEKILYSKPLLLPLETLHRGLNFLQIQPDHPIIQAALSFALILDISSDMLLALSTAYIFLYRQGYNFRRIFNLEKKMHEQEKPIRDVIAICKRTENSTPWIDYFISLVNTSLEESLGELKQLSVENSKIELTERQKDILSLLDNPETTISNKKVQQLFSVSQITASRDLAKLASCGFLFAIGKGRATYYTKV